MNTQGLTEEHWIGFKFVMEKVSAANLNILIAQLIETTSRELERYADAPDTLTGRKAGEAAIRQLTHVERLIRLTVSGSRHDCAFTAADPILPPALSQKLAELARISDRDLIAALAAARPIFPCGCSSALVLISSRKAFRCGNCGVQRSFLAGTVLANTHLPFRCWFDTALIVSHVPGISVAVLAQRLGIRRQATVRGILASIRRLNLDYPLQSYVEIAQALVQGNEPAAKTQPALA